jgi:hypothetical protein
VQNLNRFDQRLIALEQRVYDLTQRADNERANTERLRQSLTPKQYVKVFPVYLKTDSASQPDWNSGKPIFPIGPPSTSKSMFLPNDENNAFEFGLRVTGVVPVHIEGTPASAFTKCFFDVAPPRRVRLTYNSPPPSVDSFYWIIVVYEDDLPPL